MCRMQQPSAPNAVAIVSFGKNRSTAQRRICCGVEAANSRDASLICSPVITWLMPGLLVLAPSIHHDYQDDHDFVKGEGRGTVWRRRGRPRIVPRRGRGSREG